MTAETDPDFWKGGIVFTIRWLGFESLNVKHKFIVCKAQMYVKHATTTGIWGHTLRKFWNIAPSEIEFEMIYDSLMLLYM